MEWLYIRDFVYPRSSGQSIQALCPVPPCHPNPSQCPFYRSDQVQIPHARRCDAFIKKEEAVGGLCKKRPTRKRKKRESVKQGGSVDATSCEDGVGGDWED